MQKNSILFKNIYVRIIFNVKFSRSPSNRIFHASFVPTKLGIGLGIAVLSKHGIRSYNFISRFCTRATKRVARNSEHASKRGSVRAPNVCRRHTVPSPRGHAAPGLSGDAAFYGERVLLLTAAAATE